jgi:hypothetical protein
VLAWLFGAGGYGGQGGGYQGGGGEYAFLTAAHVLAFRLRTCFVKAIAWAFLQRVSTRCACTRIKPSLILFQYATGLVAIWTTIRDCLMRAQAQSFHKRCTQQQKQCLF